MDTEHQEIYIYMCVENTVKRFQEEHLLFWGDCNCVDTYLIWTYPKMLFSIQCTHPQAIKVDEFVSLFEQI